MRKFLGARYELSLVLIAGSIVLLVAIVAGNSMGNRVLGQIAGRASFSTTPVPIATASAGEDAKQIFSRRHQVLSVATDPGFPDPRFTPEPPPPSTPRPATPKPSPRPTRDRDLDPAPEASQDYTSPPLPLPIASHAADESPAPDDSSAPRSLESPPPRQAAPGRAYPSLPPTNLAPPP